MKIARVQLKTGEKTYAIQQEDGRLFRAKGDPFGGTVTATEEVLKPVRWMAPIKPRAILCIGLNYRKHAEESGASIPDYPILFMKNPYAATGNGQPIKLPKVCGDEVDYEAELAVVIAKPALNVSKEDALNYVLGYTAANDISARLWQTKLGGSQWNRAKGFDTFAPMGPVLVTADDIPDQNALAVRSELNGQEMQSSTTADMIFDVPTLIEFLSQDTTLLPGTVILTGTPQGIGWARDPKVLLKPGDTITVEVEKIGQLTNPVE